MKQKTFLIIKPDAYENQRVERILDDLKNHNLTVETQKEVAVDMNVMKTFLDHYHEVIDRMEPSFMYTGKLFNTFYYGGPKKIMLLVVSYDGAEDIIDYTRSLVGKTSPKEADPQSLRGKYSTDDYATAGKELRLVKNLIHASDSHESAAYELKVWESYLR